MEKNRKRNLRTAAAMLSALALLCLARGFTLRHYYLMSLAVGLLLAFPFLRLFAQRRPTMRELMTVAAMVGLAVLSRGLFAWAGHFKPILAIVIITAVAFGSETGLLTGALSAVASNIFFGQGPWTPWQMLAFGLAGALGGLSDSRHSPGKRLPLALFGFLCIVLAVGPLLDVYTLCMMTSSVTAETVGRILRSGFPVNLTHGAAVGLALALLSEPMLEKLYRLRDKYGMMEG